MSRYENRKWVMLTTSEAESIDFDEVYQRNAESLRWNNDGTKTFVKYEGEKPSFLTGKMALSHAEVLAELEQAEWQPE